MKWKRIYGKWYYIDGKGLKTTGMKDIGNKRYYFDSDGVMLKSTKVTIKGVEYEFDASGAMK